MKKLMVIEDDEEIRTLIEYFLKKEKYEVRSSGDGMEGLKIVREFKPDLLVLDLMLPKIDGLSIAGMIKENPEKYGNPLILMLTAKTEVDDVVIGFKAGADEYMRKPFDPRELIVRIGKLLGNTENEKIKIHKYKGVEVDTERYVVSEDGDVVELSKKEFDLMLYLIENRGIVVTREKILDKVWSSNYYSGDRTVDVYIAKLREKLKSIAKDIRTVKGVGYKLDGES
jgi:DNA-binding response OmpR family regulator